MVEPVLAAEIMGIVVLLIVMYGAYFETKQRGKKRKAFLLLCLINLIVISMDALAWVTTSKTVPKPLVFAVNMFSVVDAFWLYPFFNNYLYAHVSEKHEIPFGLFSLANISAIVLAVVFTIGSFSGSVFYLENGTFVPGKFYPLFLMSNFTLLSFIIVIILHYRKQFGVHDSIAAVSYLLIPVFSVLMNLIIPSFQYSCAAMAIVILLIYVMLQADHENKLIQNNQIVSHLAHYDELTGLPNRLAYNEAYENVKHQAQVGIVFCDLNGLKYTNDHMGHRSGDQLLRDFAHMQESFFRKEDIFRLSGDEFVILVTGLSEIAFLQRVRSFKASIAQCKMPLASIGAVYGTGAEIDALMETAEEKMYEDKKQFYVNYPLYARE